jgi:hypothetical protein
MATEAQLTAQLTAVQSQIDVLLTGAPFDHKQGEVEVKKTATYSALFTERARLEDALTRVPAVVVRQQDDTVGRFGERHVVFRGDTAT